MAELSYKQKKSFKPNVYGLPDEKKYPMPDVAHAKNAKARAQAQFDAGKLEKADLLKIETKANGMISKAGGSPAPAGTAKAADSKKEAAMAKMKMFRAGK